ncbi:hypothetical protein AHYW_001102 [Providencia manganoxydans]
MITPPNKSYLDQKDIMIYSYKAKNQGEFHLGFKNTFTLLLGSHQYCYKGNYNLKNHLLFNLSIAVVISFSTRELYYRYYPLFNFGQF